MSIASNLASKEVRADGLTEISRSRRKRSMVNMVGGRVEWHLVHRPPCDRLPSQLVVLVDQGLYGASHHLRDSSCNHLRIVMALDQGPSMRLRCWVDAPLADRNP